jgi:hypothetical protein
VALHGAKIRNAPARNLFFKEIFMNRYALTCLFSIIFLFCLLFSACSDGSDDGGGDPGEPDSTGGSPIKVTVRGENPRYFSLKTGTEVKGGAIAGTDWDIAFPNIRQIWTNSGDSATQKSSGGLGGVWHTDDSADFDSVTTFDDRKTVDSDGFDYTPFNTDLARWVIGMNANAELVTLEKNFNIMSFVGFDNETEGGVGLTEGNPYSMNYNYDKKSFYKNDPPGTMPPNFVTTGQVYIVQHGDGVHHSKIQVTRYVRNAPNETFEVRFENLD